MNKTDQLLALAQALSDARPSFFEIKGPSIGDRDTATFMKDLQIRAANAFGDDHSEKEICGKNKLRVDFYFSDEETIVEVALGLRNPLSEYERDILKAIMANEAGNHVARLVLISKPGALKRLAQPSAAAIRAWAERNHGIKVEIRELISSADNSA